MAQSHSRTETLHESYHLKDVPR